MRLIQIEYMRALAAIMVVFYHVSGVMQLDKYFGTSLFSFFSPGNSGVQVFFVISGFVIYYVHRQDSSNLASVVNFFRKRFVRIYVPLWIALFFVVPILFFHESGADLTAYEYIAAFLILPTEQSRVLAVEWTLQHEILFYLLFSLLLINRRFGLLTLLVWGVGGLIMQVIIDGPWLLEFFFSANHVLFLFGMALAWLHCNRPYQFARPVLVAGVLIFAANWAMVLILSEHGTGALLGFGLAAALVIYGLLGSGIMSSPHPFLQLLGGASYALYLIHFPIISALVKIFMKIGGYQSPIMQVIYFIITVAVCIGASIVFHLFIEKPLLRRLSGSVARSGGGPRTSVGQAGPELAPVDLQSGRG